MANSKSAEKRNRQSIVRRDRNRAHRSRMRSAVKELRTAIAEGDAATARELLPGTLSLVDHTAQRGVIHDNAAARTKSRLQRQVDALS
ncbi:MAG: 30S ribosomal protein S20 [Acidobacteriota bacterium]